MNKHKISLLRCRFVVMVSLLTASFLIAAQSSPVPMLQATSDQILATLKQHKAKLHQDRSIVFQAVQQYMVPCVDVDGMSRSVLGRGAWTKATARERAEFKQVFTQLVIRTYASPLTEYTDETVRFFPVRGSLDGQFVRVNSLIVRSNGRNIPLSYSLVSHGGQWKIYDLTVEGVSLLQSFRSQFSEVLRNSTMQALIQDMRQRAKAAVS